MPRSERITVMKCIQVDCNKGMEAAEVSRRVSAVEMLPTTLEALSTTAIEVRPSWDIRTRASAREASALGGDVSIVQDGRKDEEREKRTYLMAMICFDPICKSLKTAGYSLSITGKFTPSFQKNSSTFSWLTIPTVSPS